MSHDQVQYFHQTLTILHVRRGIIVIATLEITFIVEIILLFTKTSKLLFHVLRYIKYYQLKDLDCGRPF